MAVLLFILFWVLLGVVVFFLASSGGPRGARGRLQSQSKTGRRVAAVLIPVAYVAFGVAIPILVGVANADDDQAGSARIQLTSSEEHGRGLFAVSCGRCHSLKAANAVGQVGPNLDVLRPPKALVLDAIRNGRARGNGRMPAGLLYNQDARDVSAFVARVAGRE